MSDIENKVVTPEVRAKKRFLNRKKDWFNFKKISIKDIRQRIIMKDDVLDEYLRKSKESAKETAEEDQLYTQTTESPESNSKSVSSPSFLHYLDEKSEDDFKLELKGSAEKTAGDQQLCSPTIESPESNSKSAFSPSFLQNEQMNEKSEEDFKQITDTIAKFQVTEEMIAFNNLFVNPTQNTSSEAFYFLNENDFV